MLTLKCPTCKNITEVWLMASRCPACDTFGLQTTVDHKPYARHWKYKGYRENDESSFQGIRALSTEEIDAALNKD